MDVPPLPKQTTLIQYCMSHIARQRHNSETPYNEEKQRNAAIHTLKKAVESDKFIFKWNSMSRNKEIIIDQKSSLLPPRPQTLKLRPKNLKLTRDK